MFEGTLLSRCPSAEQYRCGLLHSRVRLRNLPCQRISLCSPLTMTSAWNLLPGCRVRNLSSGLYALLTPVLLLAGLSYITLPNAVRSYGCVCGFCSLIQHVIQQFVFLSKNRPVVRHAPPQCSVCDPPLRGAHDCSSLAHTDVQP